MWKKADKYTDGSNLTIHVQFTVKNYTYVAGKLRGFL